MSSLLGNRGQAGIASSQTNTGFNSMKEKIPSGYKKGTLQQFTPEQMQLFQQLFSHVGPDSFLSKLIGGDQGTFAEMEAPALRQFSELQGNLASRFSGMGTGARRSSGFQNTMTSAASDFASQLQSQRQNLQRQALMDLMGISSSLLGQRPYEQFLVEKQQKPGWGGAIGAGLGGLGGLLAGGPAGALSGASIGYGIGSGKGNNTSFSSSPEWDLNQYLPIFGNV